MKLNVKKTIYVGSAFLIICMFWQVYDNIIAKMLINSFGLNQTLSGVVLALDNIVALFLLPLFGNFSDKVNTKYGKRTPFITLGIIVAAILFVGVSISDSYQQNLVAKHNLPEIVDIENLGNVIGYKYDDKEILEVKDSQGKVIGYRFADNEGDELDAYDLVGAKQAIENVKRADVWNITKGKIIYFIIFISLLFIVLVVMGTFRSPAVSLMPDVTPKPLRSKANAIINLMGAVGGIISLIIMFFLAKDFQSYVPTFVVLAILMLLLLSVFLWKVKEPKLVEEMREISKQYGLEEDDEEEVSETSNTKMPKAVFRSFLLILLAIIFWFMAYNAAISKFSVYAGQILDMKPELPLLMANITAIIAFIPIGIISTKFGRKKTILCGIIILTLAFILGTIATKNTTFLIYLTMSIAGIGWATINVNSYPMIVEMSRSSNIGKYTGYYYTASMSAQILTPVLSGALMDGFNDMRVLFPYSVFFCVLAFITMLFVKHGDAKPIPEK